MELQISKGMTNSVSTVNEDIYNITKNAAWVIDGATGLTKKNITGFKSDARWYVEQWNYYLKENISNDMSLKEIVKRGISVIKNQYEKFAGYIELSKLDYPCAAIVLIRLKNDKMEYFVLGDSSLIYKNGNEVLKELYDEKLEQLEMNIFNNINRIKEEKNISMLVAKEFCLDKIRDTRLLKNTEGGYWILELDERAVDYAICGQVNIEVKIKICMVSDGFSQYYDTLHIVKDSDEFLELAEKNDLNVLCEKLRCEQNRDEMCDKYPRLKKSDDATVVYLEIG